MAKTGKPVKTIAYLVYPGVSLLELTGSYAIGQSFLISRKDQYSVTTVAERAGPLETDTPLGIVPGKTFAELPHPDLLFVMGGGGLAALFALESDALLDYVRQAVDTAGLVVGVSSGALILAAAGLLQGNPAATHWAYARLLEHLGVEYAGKRWVQDGKFITTSGGTAGIDMGLELVAERVSRRLARLQQLFLEYDPEPLFGPVDWSQVDFDALAPVLVENREKLRQALARQPQVLAAVEAWLAEAAQKGVIHA